MGETEFTQHTVLCAHCEH